MSNLKDAAIAKQVDCGSRCDGILASLKEATALLDDLVGSSPASDRAINEPSSKMDRLELWLDDIDGECRHVVTQLRILTNRIG